MVAILESHITVTMYLINYLVQDKDEQNNDNSYFLKT